MRQSRFLQLDVFAASVGGGNPLGVVVDANDWSQTSMQRFAAWTNLVETTFLLAPTTTQANYRVRIFTPQREIPFAGHPSIGSAHAALESGFVDANSAQLVQECGAGLLPIGIEGQGAQRQLFVSAPRARILQEAKDEPLLHTVLGNIKAGALAPVLVEGGRRWWLAELGSESILRQWQPDPIAIAALAKAYDCLGLCVFARSIRADYELVVRAFPAGVGIIEDPASGAANGLIAAYIRECEPHGALANGYRVSQGREIGHDAAIRIRIDNDQTIWVGGETRTIISGEVYWNA